MKSKILIIISGVLATIGVLALIAEAWELLHKKKYKKYELNDKVNPDDEDFFVDCKDDDKDFFNIADVGLFDDKGGFIKIKSEDDLDTLSTHRSDAKSTTATSKSNKKSKAKKSKNETTDETDANTSSEEDISECFIDELNEDGAIPDFNAFAEGVKRGTPSKVSADVKDNEEPYDFENDFSVSGDCEDDDNDYEDYAFLANEEEDTELFFEEDDEEDEDEDGLISKEEEDAMVEAYFNSL